MSVSIVNLTEVVEIPTAGFIFLSDGQSAAVNAACESGEPGYAELLYRGEVMDTVALPIGSDLLVVPDAFGPGSAEVTIILTHYSKATVGTLRGGRVGVTVEAYASGSHVAAAVMSYPAGTAVRFR